MTTIEGTTMHHHHDRDRRTADLFARIDDALGGHELQRSTEHAPGGGDGCVRCGAAPEPDSGFCGPCRAFMLGDLEVDPVPLHVAHPGSGDGQELEQLRSAGWLVAADDGRPVATGRALQLFSAALRPVSS